MADILRITTPVVNKNQPVQAKPGAESVSAASLQDISRIAATPRQGELSKQGNGLIQDGNSPTILTALLKDPSVTVTYLKNIFMLEEFIKLLPANNKTVTKEIEQLFQSLLISPDEIGKELTQQENSSTIFKGEIFDFLRNISDNNPPESDIQGVIANLLKSINNMAGKDDILDAVANSLQFLRKNLSASQKLTQKLDYLLRRFRREDAAKNFPELKKEALDLFKEIEDSILYSPKLAKVVSITVYNLSRYNDNTDYFHESYAVLWNMLPPAEREKLDSLMQTYLSQLSRGEKIPPSKKTSDVLKVLSELISLQAENETQTVVDSEKIESIIHSLLSSPCNFTPLLHFIIPVIFDDIKSFAEIWINPRDDENSDEKGISVQKSSSVHLLMVIDIDAIGRFEAEIKVLEKNVKFVLYCPAGYEQAYSEIIPSLSGTSVKSGYRFSEVRVERLEHSRSLMEVFKSLPYKRTGVDVKI